MSIFKKALIAAAVLGISGTASAALDFDVKAPGKKTPSPEAISTADYITTEPALFTTGADYQAGDTIKLISNLVGDATQNFATTTITGTCPTVGGVTATMTVSFAGYDAASKTVAYDVLTATGSTSAGTGCVVEFPGIRFDGAEVVAADKVTLALSTTRTIGILEAVAAVDFIDVGATQFALAVGTSADGIIDLSKNRNAFVGAANDQIIVTLSDAATGATLTAGTTKTVVSGDFSWAKTVNPTTGAISYPAIAVTGGITGNPVITDSTITYVQTANATTITFTPPTAANDLRTLLVGAYSLVTTVTYTDLNNTGGAATQTKELSSAAGSWTLNGTSITALGVSNSNAVTPLIWIQNAGSTSGAISGSVNCNGNTIQIADLGTATALSNTKVGAAIQAAVDADGTCPTSNTRYDATVLVNSPASDITMSAAYKVTTADGSTDRVNLETTDSLDGQL